MNDYKINFQELKARVGIDDVAFALGYRLDKKAGVGKYIELVLGDGNAKTDVIVVNNTRDKAAQRYFRRDGSKGDVVTLIRENLNYFNVSGNNEWQKVANVMARFANMPEQEYSQDREYVKQAKVQRVFDPTRYLTKSLDRNMGLPVIFARRGLSDETVRAFTQYISLIRDSRNERFNGFNIGFPYKSVDDGSVCGYEIRGLQGYKSKAAGTNSSTAAWIAEFHFGKADENRKMVENIFLFESSFDAMAFYQLNHSRMGTHYAVASLGGTFSNGQIESITRLYPNAKLWDCFDNDIAGRIYAIRLMSLTEGIPMKISKMNNALTIEAKGILADIDMSKDISEQVSNIFSLKRLSGKWVPPVNFKDWNDVLLNKPIKPIIGVSKHDRNENLAEHRKSTFKI